MLKYIVLTSVVLLPSIAHAEDRRKCIREMYEVYEDMTVAKSLCDPKNFVSDPNERKRQLAKTLGADEAIDPTGADLVELVHEHTGGKGVEYLRDLAEHQQRLLLGRGSGVIVCHDANVPVTRPDHCR